jgi:hypothetical protein
MYATVRVFELIVAHETKNKTVRRKYLLLMSLSNIINPSMWRHLNPVQNPMCDHFLMGI